MHKILLAIVFSQFAYPSLAMTGNTLKPFCENFPRASQETYLCIGHIGGVIDTFQSINGQKRELGICLPSGVTGEQLTAMGVKYLFDHPEELHNDMPVIILKMLSSSFPCSK